MTIIANMLGTAREWAANQLNPHIPVNEGIAANLILEHAMKAKGTSTPPGSPAEGEAHIIGASPTGDWSTFTENNIAYYHNGAWREMVRQDRLTVFVESGATSVTLWRYDATGAAWEKVLLGDDPDVLKRNATATLTVGYTNAGHNAGTVSSGTFTPSVANGHMQRLVNGGAFTLAPPAAGASIHLKITNNASAGAITTTGFSVVTGDAFTTVDGDVFLCTLANNDGTSHLHVTAVP